MNTKHFRVINRVLIAVYLAAAVLIFILSLGYMTNFHRLFYDGNDEMFEFYKSLQVYNKVLFKSAVAFVISSVLYFGFLKDKAITIFRTVISVLLVFVSIFYTVNLYRSLPFYINWYSKFDFSELDGYVPSYFVFSANRLLFIIINLTALLIAVLSFIRLIKAYAAKPSVRKEV